MKKINLKNYDFLWTMYNLSYFFNSIGLTKNYLDRDFIVISDHNACSYYVSKKERVKLSLTGLELFQNNFAKFKSSALKDLAFAKNFFKKQQLKDISQFSDKLLAENFSAIIKVWDKLLQNYFWTEYYCLDRINEIIIKQPNSLIAKKLQKIVILMAKLKYEQRKILNIIFFPDSLMTEYYRIIAKRLNLTVEQINNYSYQELISLLRGKKIIVPDRTYVVKGKFSSWQDILGKPAKKIIDELGKFEKNIKTIKGQAGNPGFYKGRIKIVDFDLKLEKTYQQMKEMKKGQVLVSGSTGPEMILACKKAGAIITDEGGITSHAAIVSRELKIPCVIATKYATKILKDGDLVEVDANKGNVKILK